MRWRYGPCEVSTLLCYAVLRSCVKIPARRGLAEIHHLVLDTALWLVLTLTLSSVLFVLYAEHTLLEVTCAGRRCSHDLSVCGCVCDKNVRALPLRCTVYMQHTQRIVSYSTHRKVAQQTALSETPVQPARPKGVTR